MIKPEIFDSAEILHKAAADFFVDCYKSAIAERDEFHVALSGGSTPRALYQLLAKAPYQSSIDWSKVHCYFGDERFVPHDHADSNFKMASEALIDHVPFNDENIHAVPTHLDNAEAAAQAYQQEMKNHLPHDENGQLNFDLVLLGLGTDGHTASLFPGTLALEEQQASCVAVYVEKMQSWRVSITFPVINHGKHILLLSEGASKVDIIASLMQSDATDSSYPIQRIKPCYDMRWFIDKSAANLV